MGERVWGMSLWFWELLTDSDELAYTDFFWAFLQRSSLGSGLLVATRIYEIDILIQLCLPLCCFSDCHYVKLESLCIFVVSHLFSSCHQAIRPCVRVPWAVSAARTKAAIYA